MQRIRLITSQQEIQDACAVADKIERAHIERGDHTPRLKNLEGCPYKENQTGMIGEFMVGRLLGLPVDTSIRINDKGIDFTSPHTGKTLDVKTSWRKSPTSRFSILMKEQNLITGYADYILHAELLISGGIPVIDLHGYVSTVGIHNWPREASKFPGSGARLVCPGELLRPTFELVNVRTEDWIRILD